jgi:hypothetical protein
LNSLGFTVNHSAVGKSNLPTTFTSRHKNYVIATSYQPIGSAWKLKRPAGFADKYGSVFYIRLDRHFRVLRFTNADFHINSHWIIRCAVIALLPIFGS